MELKHLFYKHMTVADGMKVPVSRHFYYSQFGVRGRHAPINMGGLFITTDAPGVGFFVKASDSHSYRRFVKECRLKQKQNLWTLIARKEPNYERQIAKVEKLVQTAGDEHKSAILSAYLQVLYIAKDAELMEKIIRGVKDKMGHKTTKQYVSVLSHYKSSLATLDHDVSAVQPNIKNTLSEEQLTEWEKVVDAFREVVNARRLWSVVRGGNGEEDAYVQVFADMGIFDFIQSPFDTPVLRDHQGQHYYFYPNGVVRARSSVDFDCFPYDQLTLQSGVVELSTLTGTTGFVMGKANKKRSHHKGQTDAVGALYGQSRDNRLGMLNIPEMELHLLCNHVAPVVEFERALNAFVGRKN